MDPAAFSSEVQASLSPPRSRTRDRSRSPDHRDYRRNRDRRDSSRDYRAARDTSRDRRGSSRDRDSSRDRREPFPRGRDGVSEREARRDITREAMTIPRDNISDFLTKIAHGERLDLQHYGRQENGVDAKRRRVSDSVPDGYPPRVADSVPDGYSPRAADSVPDGYGGTPPPREEWKQSFQPVTYAHTQVY